MIDAHIAPRTTLSHLNTPAIAARRSFHRVVGNLADQAPSSWAQPRATGAANEYVAHPRRWPPTSRVGRSSSSTTPVGCIKAIGTESHLPSTEVTHSAK